MPPLIEYEHVFVWRPLPTSSSTPIRPSASWTVPRPPRRWPRRAAEMGYAALALTDHDGLCGSLAFAHAARAAGVRPITGAEVTLRGGAHLTLLAEDARGYANLCRLLTLAHADTRPPPDRRPLPPALDRVRPRGPRRGAGVPHRLRARGRWCRAWWRAGRPPGGRGGGARRWSRDLGRGERPRGDPAPPLAGGPAPGAGSRATWPRAPACRAWRRATPTRTPPSARWLRTPSWRSATA